MRLERIALKGLSSAFPDVVDLSLRDLAPGVVALVGPNGNGKTILLESTPAAIYRQMPSRDGKDPVSYATGRDSYIEQEFSVDGRGAFRIRLNLDGPKRQSDAVLEAILPDGTRAPLNDGKRSTFDAVIRDRFPSFELFINSSFAAQGRGDEFTRSKPAQRKDLFNEFLALQHYAVKAKAAAEAAELADDARMRLTARIEQLQRDTAPALLAEIDRQAKELQVRGGNAEVRQRELQPAIADLETQLALLSDQVAANAAAAQRVRQLETDLALRRADHAALDVRRQKAADALAGELARIIAKRDADVTDANNRIHGNHQIQDLGPKVRGAVSAIAEIEPQLVKLRELLAAAQADLQQNATDLRIVERRLADLTFTDQAVKRARSDAALLETVPCGGAGVYAACLFLRNATAAQARIADLEAELRPRAALADQVAALVLARDVITETIENLRGELTKLEHRKAEHQKLAKYDTQLAESTERVKQLEAASAKATADAEQLSADAQGRHDSRVAELDTQSGQLTAQIVTLAADVDRAAADLEATATGNRQAAQLQAELTAARREWDSITAAIATAENGRQELERRRIELVSKMSDIAVLQRRLARVQQELLEWRDLAKALGKGGLPDLEIDQAGPTISALTNEILLDCFGPRFSIELVTQVEKADGGMKDEFTVRVLDNEKSGGWRDISDLSGGQKVIVQEALMCAICIFVNERSPMPIRTLWRDETGAALDAEHAVQYVQMLRKVRTLGGYHHVFYVSHDAAVQALADAQIRVGGGQARIVLAPFSEEA